MYILSEELEADFVKKGKDKMDHDKTGGSLDESKTKQEWDISN
jgi:hypothetical protein